MRRTKMTNEKLQEIVETIWNSVKETTNAEDTGEMFDLFLAAVDEVLITEEDKKSDNIKWFGLADKWFSEESCPMQNYEELLKLVYNNKILNYALISDPDTEVDIIIAKYEKGGIK
jgi:hypothetical protein